MKPEITNRPCPCSGAVAKGFMWVNMDNIVAMERIDIDVKDAPKASITLLYDIGSSLVEDPICVRETPEQILKLSGV